MRNKSSALEFRNLLRASLQDEIQSPLESTANGTQPCLGPGRHTCRQEPSHLRPALDTRQDTESDEQRLCERLDAPPGKLAVFQQAGELPEKLQNEIRRLDHCAEPRTRPVPRRCQPRQRGGSEP